MPGDVKAGLAELDLARDRGADEIGLDAFTEMPAWQRLNGAEVYMFEDTPTGIISLQAAWEILSKMGIQIEPSYYGIASKPVKRKALLASSAQVYPTLAQALARVI